MEIDRIQTNTHQHNSSELENTDNKRNANNDDDDEEEEDEEDDNDEEATAEILMRTRSRYVKACLEKVKRSDQPYTKVSSILEVRRQIIKDFLMEIGKGKRCHSCKG